MICKNCGCEISDNSRFCTNCGKSVINQQNESINTNNIINNDNQRVDIPQWYYLNDKGRQGPFSEEFIVFSINNGTIESSTMVWKEGMKDWIQAVDTSLSVHFNNVVPKIPANCVSDKWLWAFATVAPLFNFVFYCLFENEYELTRLMTVFVMYIIFLILDIRYLRKNGIKALSWIWLGLLIQPVYIFYRAAKTTKNYFPGVVYCLILLTTCFISLA